MAQLNRASDTGIVAAIEPGDEASGMTRSHHTAGTHLLGALIRRDVRPYRRSGDWGSVGAGLRYTLSPSGHAGRDGQGGSADADPGANEKRCVATFEEQEHER